MTCWVSDVWVQMFVSTGWARNKRGHVSVPTGCVSDVQDHVSVSIRW